MLTEPVGAPWPIAELVGDDENLLPELLIKAARDRDLYVVWSWERDWPVAWGSREQLAPSPIAIQDFERADVHGISAIGDDRVMRFGAWEDPSGFQVGDWGRIFREDFDAVIARLEEAPDDDLSDFAVSLDDLE